MGSGGMNVPLAMQAYGICSKDSNAMKSANPRSGIYEAETSRTLDANGGKPACNQGGIAVCVQGSIIGRSEENGPHGNGVNENVSFTLNTCDKHAVAYAMTTGCYSEVHEEKAATLMARDYKDMQIVNCPQYIVRRLTPMECTRLQGFPDWWCDGLETPEPTDDEIAWWAEVLETHRKIMGTSLKPKSRNQIVRWLQNPHSDSAEYKMWGNGVALPCVCFVLAGIAKADNLKNNP
jgi:DNA (cytosine-5)-methyltransferase 1